MRNSKYIILNTVLQKNELNDPLTCHQQDRDAVSAQ